MDASALDRLYEDASLAAASLEQDLSWLEADDTRITHDRGCRSDFVIRVTAAGATREQQLESLAAELQACLDDLRRLSAASTQGLGKRLAPSARQRTSGEIRKSG
jgi:hypothetical protein